MIKKQKTKQEDNFINQKHILIDEIVRKDEENKILIKEKQLLNLTIQSYNQHINDFNRRHSRGV